MKIAFTGSHSTGKTTLVNQLREHPYFSEYYFDTDSTRWIKQYNLGHSQSTTDLSQQLIFLKKLAILYSYDSIICDRTTIDVMAYTTWAIRNKKFESSGFEESLHFFEKSLGQYDYIFHLKPEFDIVHDCYRPTDSGYQFEIAKLIEEYISEYQVNVHHLTGSVDQRTKQIFDILHLTQ